MRVIKRQSKKTYQGKDKKDYHYINYFLELDNGKRVAIRTFKVADLATLDAVANYERWVWSHDVNA